MQPFRRRPTPQAVNEALACFGAVFRRHKAKLIANMPFDGERYIIGATGGACRPFVAVKLKLAG
jgi:hypothetical protein